MRVRLSVILLICLVLLSGCETAPGQPVPLATQTTAPDTPPEETAPVTMPATEPTQSQEPAQPEVPEATAPPLHVPEEDVFVPVDAYIPDILVELRYATDHNFTGECIYGFERAFLRYGTVEKLAYAQQRLRELGYGLKIWDAFRPVSAQFTLWEVCPDPNYVANPNVGYSNHSRGNTLDVTLVDAWGNEVAMPTGFDDFSSLADRNYADCPEEAAGNALLLQSILEEAGFTGYYGEWWHFSDTVQYEVEKNFTPASEKEYYALCNEFITLRTRSDVSSGELLKIPANGVFTVMAADGDFYYVNYKGVYGFVLASYTAPVSD